MLTFGYNLKGKEGEPDKNEMEGKARLQAEGTVCAKPLFLRQERNWPMRRSKR